MSKTVAEVMLEQCGKIASALDQLQKVGLPRDIIILCIQKKTRLPQRDIIAVLDALKDFQKQIKVQTQ